MNDRTALALALFLVAALPIALVPVAVAAGPAGTSAPGLDWPHWRGPDHAGSGTRAGEGGEGAFELRVRWRKEVGSGYSAVVVAGDLAVTMASDGRRDRVVALDADDGATRWVRDVGPTFPGREGAADGPTSTPAIAGDTVYALAPRGVLHALDRADGAPRWSVRLRDAGGQPLAPPHWGFGSSPLVVDDLVVVVPGAPAGRAAVAFDRATGAEVWAAGAGEEPGYASPILARLAGRRQLIVGSDTTLHGLDPANGQTLWSFEHGGAGFYRRIVNPVVLGEDRLLLTVRPDEALLLRVVRRGDGFAVESVGTTPHLKRNYATPVRRDGRVYGMSGSFLSCIAADDGRLLWKTRGAGDGWPLLVDDLLFVLTRAGTLHVAPASAEEYRESASLTMFDALVWSPPSFARGRVYGRDAFLEVAAVDLVPAGRAGARHGSGADDGDADDASSAKGPGAETSTPFERGLARLRAMPPEGRAAAASALLDGVGSFPVVEGSRAHFVWTGAAEDVALSADPLPLRAQRPLERIALGADEADAGALFVTSLDLAPDARIGYRFVVDLDRGEPDPRNPVRSHSFARGGEGSLLRMPEAPPLAPTTAGGAALRGRVETWTLASGPVAVGGKTWGGERRIRVYLPPGTGRKGDGTTGAASRLPTLYVLYGLRLAEQAELVEALDAAIDAGTIAPTIAILVESISPYEYARSQRGVHGRMLAEQLVPEIDRRYATLPAPGARTLAGADEGGFAALDTALRYPHVFGNVVAQSVLPIGPGGRQLLDTIALQPELPLRLHLSHGRYDPVDPRDGTDVPAFGRRLAAALRGNGYDPVVVETADGPDLRALAARLLAALAAGFPGEAATRPRPAPPGTPAR